MEISEVLKVEELLIIITRVKQVRHKKECWDICQWRLVNKKFCSVIDQSVFPRVKNISSSLAKLFSTKFPGLRYINTYYCITHFSGFQSLTSLYLVKVTCVDLAKLTTLTNLSLTNMNVTDSDLSCLANLRSVTLENCPEITPKSLSVLTNLTELNLNQIYTITDHCLQILGEKLKILSLSSVSAVSNTTLERMSCLTNLTLANGMQDNCDVLGRLVNLNYLSLQYGHLVGLGEDSLKTLTQLETLRLYVSPYGVNESGIYLLTQITTLVLDHQFGINYLSALTNLTHLSLSHSPMPQEITCLKSLRSFHYLSWRREDNDTDFSHILDGMSLLTDLSLRVRLMSACCDLRHMTNLRCLQFSGGVSFNCDTTPTLPLLTTLMLDYDPSVYIYKHPPPLLKNLYVEFEKKPSVEFFELMPSLSEISLCQDYLDQELQEYFYHHYINCTTFH